MGPHMAPLPVSSTQHDDSPWTQTGTHTCLAVCPGYDGSSGSICRKKYFINDSMLRFGLLYLKRWKCTKLLEI